MNYAGPEKPLEDSQREEEIREESPKVPKRNPASLQGKDTAKQPSHVPGGAWLHKEKGYRGDAMLPTTIEGEEQAAPKEKDHAGQEKPLQDSQREENGDESPKVPKRNRLPAKENTP
ncbi:hypothetical protein NDU88_000849 [Pleurodeles waltl]|uniref:Uncharacterized protein n=1 Tax=Pleurodeles waltl TaxID=8319 RepID=A0AAV7TIF0_PLEWA|nr:hypothetical protein NDU88_000849 [Pleurodeles waltl]